MTSFRKHPWFVPALMLLACLACGCRGGRTPHTIKLHYNAMRPGLIRDSGRQGLPPEVSGRRIDSVAAGRGLVAFGVRDTGVFVYDPQADSWTAIPFDPHPLNDELILTSLAMLDGTVYAAASGIGVLRCALEDRTCRPLPGDKRLKSIYSLAAVGGRIWIASVNGLFMFDPDTGIISQVLKDPALAVAGSRDRAWAISAPLSDTVEIVGIDSVTRKIVSRQHLPQGIQGGRALCVRDGHVFLTTIGGRFVDYDPKSGAVLVTSLPDKMAGVVPVQMTGLGDEFAIASESGLLLYRPGGEFRLVQQAHGLPSARMTGVAASGGALYLGLASGAFVVTPDRLADMKHLAQTGADGTPEAVCENAATVSEWHHLTVTDGLLNNVVTTLMPLNGEVWAGTNILGLTRITLDPPAAKSFIPPSPDRAKGDRAMLAVMELAADGDEIWHGGHAYFGRFSRSRGRWAAPLTNLDQPYEYDVEALWVGPDQVWMGVRKEGLRVLDRKSGEWKRYAPDFLNLSPLATDIVPAAGALWISSDIGLRRYNEKKDSFVFVDIEGVHDIESMAADGDTLWIGARERSTPPGPRNTGLFRYNVRTRHLVPMSTGAGARLTHVNKVFVDGPDVWVAARQGLGRFDRLTGEWTVYATDRDLDAGDILSVAVAAEWLIAGTDNGLFLKRIRAFDDPAERTGFLDAWNAERAGREMEAAQAYEQLAARLPRAAADRMLYRAAHCLERAGRTADALRLERALLPRYPLLALDMESALAADADFDAWLAEVDILARSAKTRINADPDKAALLRAHLQFLTQPLAQQARVQSARR